MLEVGMKIDNKGQSYSILEIKPKQIKIQFAKTQHVMWVNHTQVRSSRGDYGALSMICDPLDINVRGFARLGLSSVPHPNDRRDRAMIKATDKLWKYILDDYEKGIKAPKSWLTKASFELWLVETHGDRWKDFVENDMRLFPVGKHGRKNSMLVDYETYKLYGRKTGITISRGKYLAFALGKSIATRVDKASAVAALIEYIKGIEVPELLRDYLITSIEDNHD